MAGSKLGLELLEEEEEEGEEEEEEKPIELKPGIPKARRLPARPSVPSRPKEYFEWIGNGYGMFYYEYPYRPTDVLIKNVLDLKITKSGIGESEMSLDGKILLRIIPRKDITYPPEPIWITAMKMEEGELPPKTMFGYLAIPVPEFIKLDESGITEGVKQISKGVFKLIVNKKVTDILKENKVIFEFPYTLDLDKLKEYLKKHEEIIIRNINIEEFLRTDVLSISWLILDLTEEAFKYGLQSQLQRIDVLARQLMLSPTQFIETITNIKESFGKVSDYVILVVSIKNETLGTLFQSTINIDKIELIFPEASFGIEDVIIPLNIKGRVDIKPGEGKIEITGGSLNINQEVSFAIGIRQSVISKVMSSEEKGIKIRVQGSFVYPPDIITGVISRVLRRISYGLVYFTPMGYPISFKARYYVPQNVLGYPLPGTRTEIRLTMEERIPIEIQLREPIQKEIPLSMVDMVPVVKTLKKTLEALGFSMLYDSDIKRVRFAEPWDEIVELRYLLYKGAIEGLSVTLFIEVYSRIKHVSVSLTGQGRASKSTVSERRKLSDVKVLIRSIVPPKIIPKVMEIFEGLKERLESIGR